MELKKTNFTLLGIIIVLFIVAVLAFIKVLFLNVKGFEWGSVTDWVSAACNLAMAGAAVYAAYNAKDWISPKIQHEGFKQASTCMAEMVQLRILQQHLISSYRLRIIQNSNPTPMELQDAFKRHHEIWQEFSKKVIDFGTRCESLTVWKISVLQTDKFLLLIKTLNRVNRLHSDMLRQYKNESNLYNVLLSWKDKNDDIEELHHLLAQSIKDLTVDFDTLFK
ncbi:Uncharacterised protein [Enterobacter cloacae]|uniref:hypothetical protein n=1 Tax=Enterobacter cloacae TaxID=550 RepID=UPI000792E2F8|nr:hypothetical protein [Enterobacter cloacae]CZY40041.1 Uncharacterised protein [Enterobacter cloacae]